MFVFVDSLEGDETIVNLNHVSDIRYHKPSDKVYLYCEGLEFEMSYARYKQLKEKMVSEGIL